MRPDQAWNRAPAMTYLPGRPAGPVGADPVIVLRRRFPGLVFWYGSCTRSWWAIVRVSQGWRLVEAMDGYELTQAVLTAATWPYPPALTPERSSHPFSAFGKKESFIEISDKGQRDA